MDSLITFNCKLDLNTISHVLAHNPGEKYDYLVNPENQPYVVIYCDYLDNSLFDLLYKYNPDPYKPPDSEFINNLNKEITLTGIMHNDKNNMYFGG